VGAPGGKWKEALPPGGKKTTEGRDKKNIHRKKKKPPHPKSAGESRGIWGDGKKKKGARGPSEAGRKATGPPLGKGVFARRATVKRQSPTPGEMLEPEGKTIWRGADGRKEPVGGTAAGPASKSFLRKQGKTALCLVLILLFVGKGRGVCQRGTMIIKNRAGPP